MSPALMASSHILLGIPHNMNSQQLSSSAIGKAYARADLDEVHEILENDGYNKDELATFEVSFQSWTGQLSDSIVVKNHGDSAFQSKDFATALECYSRFIDTGVMVSPTMLARRSFANMVLGKLQEGIADARKAEEISPEWPTPYYLQGMALLGLGMELEGHEKLKKGVALEAGRNGRTRTV